MVSRPGTRSKQETLDWTAAGGNPTSIDNLEVLYENDEVAVLYHSANNSNGDGTAMAIYTRGAINSLIVEPSDRRSKR